MKKIQVILACAAFLAVAGGCSIKQSLGYVNNEITWRQYMDNIKTEVSLGVEINNTFDDGVDDIPGLYYVSSETGRDTVDAALGLAFYYGLFSNETFSLSAGLKYRNYFRADYSYTYFYEAYSDSRRYRYEESMQVDFFSSNRVSIMFPDVEIICPFAENLKFTVTAELVHVKWSYKGGNYLYSFWQEASTEHPYEEGGSDSVSGPGAVNSVSFGSDLFSAGAINIGVLYYFR